MVLQLRLKVVPDIRQSNKTVSVKVADPGVDDQDPDPDLFFITK